MPLCVQLHKWIKGITADGAGTLHHCLLLCPRCAHTCEGFSLVGKERQGEGEMNAVHDRWPVELHLTEAGNSGVPLQDVWEVPNCLSHYLPHHETTV